MPGDPLFAAAGALRSTYAAVEWSCTPLGPVPSWDRALRAAVSLTLSTSFPTCIFWGPDLVMIYNEAYAILIADKHPRALGARAVDMFPEAWDVIGPLFQNVLAGQGATWAQDELVPLESDGRLLERFFTFSYSPLTNDDGQIAGVIDIVADTTQQSQDRRRLQLLTRLSAAVADLQDPLDLPALALPVLRSAPQDFPAVDVHLPGVPVLDGETQLPRSPSTPLEGRTLVVEATGSGMIAWLALAASMTPAGGSALTSRPGQAVLVVRLSEHLVAGPAYLDFLNLIAGLLSQALDRAGARDLERRSASLQRELSETLQRSLLTKPVQSDDLQVAVRYRAAAEQAKIGGDWYDSFLTPAGTLTVVVGDVTGHDHHAAAVMAQLRNLLRGTSFALGAPPAAVLTGLDQAMIGLGVGVLASAVLAQVEQDAEQAEAGIRVVRWSNAGHPPPLLLGADGSARLLEGVPDLLLGLDATTTRTDSTAVLEGGSSVVLYTDGLVERRGTPLQVSLRQLREHATGQQHLGAEELCEYLLARLGHDQDDDIVILVVRAHAQDEPLPSVRR